MITFQRESFLTIKHELPELFQRHWEEVALDHMEVPLDPDWRCYSEMATMGILHVVTARDNGRLIGYYFAIVRPHLHYKSTLTAFSDIFIIMPEYRKGWTGYRLLKEAEKMLKDIGVRKSYLMTKVHIPLILLVKRLKYRFVERVYTKLL